MSGDLSATEIASMRTTVEDVALSMTCTIQRMVAGPDDAGGQPTGTWGQLHTDMPCLFWIEDRRTEAEIAGPNVGFVMSHQMIQLKANVDVREGDHVSSVFDVEDENGDREQIASDLNIEEVRHRITDTVLVIEEVR